MLNSFRECLLRVFNEYSSATETPFAGNTLAAFIRYDFPAVLKRYSEIPERYIWQGSAGQGNWARAPWLAVFDVLVTDSVQSGYYPVYLFREDLTGVYLSLNQGVTEIREKYQSKAKDALQTHAADFLAQLGTVPTGFETGIIDLRPTGTQNLSAYYQAGSICAKLYDRDSIPDEHILIADFHSILAAYDLLSYNETVPIGSGLHEEDEKADLLLEDLRKFRQHKRIERNARLVREVKRIQGYTCRLCGFNFEESYGDIGHHFIEAHHLTPISALKGKVILLNPAKDFTVLCSNCHSMVHRCEAPHDITGFKEKYM